MRNVAHRMANIPDVSVLTIEVRRLAEAIYEGCNRTRGQVDAETQAKAIALLRASAELYAWVIENRA